MYSSACAWFLVRLAQAAREPGLELAAVDQPGQHVVGRA